MQNYTVLAAAEGLPCATRRALLFGLAAASTTAAIAVAPDAQGADVVQTQSLAHQAENPELVTAYQKFNAACTELKKAHDELEWLADEWRHQWPLAPEELLLGANAQDGRYTVPAERDIIGRYLVRDTSELTKRFPAKFRREFRKTCFTLRTSQDERERLRTWLQRTPTGRTAKSLEESRAFRLKAMKECELRIQLAERYEAETTRIRRISGADAAQQRVKDADAQVYEAADEVSRCQARTVAGFKMKADALAITASGLITLTGSDSPLGQIARFVNAVAEFAGRASV
ncbi:MULTISPECIES: hypothetical protein [Rhizobium]|uniref:hypothetical protein n=1 Tax=Rhizobium TaxID=379 RepID=UPI001B33920D|nr:MULTISPECIES: hypothetical protein [Rhizobium]MBX4911214.1 hypothetical protein [Rhizobium bangladeshense]MBX5260331.1 hypothetical protein [Rhizobium sp. NLR16b]MBX5266421.1 hypothetical protein [Rhizobium sp. NLR16a]MBX5314989.1 hypothetical protein [Rhizobium sp. NLR11b]QTU98151.1 hypothetical protein J7U39_08325 [Rhizobium sp. NLR16a]